MSERVSEPVTEPASELRDPATPTAERCVTSYPARRAYRPGVVHPPQAPGVQGMVDIHCHAHEGQQDALSLAKFASEAGMRAILYKTIGAISGEYRPARGVAAVREGLARWSDETGIAPIECLAGYGVTMDNRPPTLARLRQALDDGVAGVWLHVFNHALTLHKVGGKFIWWNKDADPAAHSAPLPWDEALRHGHYLLDERGRLKPLVQDMLRMVFDADIALFYGHGTHPEFEALTEFVDKAGFRRAVIDHPFSPFIDLSVAQMKQHAAAGVTLNFTFDELSPLLGVDPARMAEAVRAVGVEHVTLSSDAGEPLFPNTVECMRLVSGYMAAFGLDAAAIDRTCRINPARIAGLPVS